MTKSKHIIVFTCNWNAYNSLETAGNRRISYSADILPIKVSCLGQINPGLVFKAFQKGAAGVILLGCSKGECHYEFGNRYAEEVFSETQQLARLLGIREEQLTLDWLAAGEGESFVDKVQTMLVKLNGDKAS